MSYNWGKNRISFNEEIVCRYWGKLITPLLLPTTDLHGTRFELWNLTASKLSQICGLERNFPRFLMYSPKDIQFHLTDLKKKTRYWKMFKGWGIVPVFLVQIQVRSFGFHSEWATFPWIQIVWGFFVPQMHKGLLPWFKRRCKILATWTYIEKVTP